ncbi:hypothetical protein [Lentzea xinjiangensis]|uniref:hypothetical protein n=1 Tax=Lentzea xinjiangensis TaxID=402600 RepID=UPI00116066C4|nr:hypothetical protein [Lentzea xinjiangensis]
MHDDQANKDATVPESVIPPASLGNEKPTRNIRPKKTSRKKWRHRTSIHQLKSGDPYATPARRTEIDAEMNNRFMPPPDESLHLASFTLIEAYTPTTVYRLSESLNKLQNRLGGAPTPAIEHLERSRNLGLAGGWVNIDLIRRPGKWVHPSGYIDPTLPEGISAATTTIVTATPSLTILVCTFILEEEEGNLTKPLLETHQTEYGKVNVFVEGALGSLRSKIPWARPRRFSTTRNTKMVWQLKKEETDAIFERYEAPCSEWFESRFPGRFSEELLESRPKARLIVTRKEKPISTGGLTWTTAAGINSHWDLWASTSPEGWTANVDRFRNQNSVLTFSGVRAVLGELTSGPDDERESKWTISQGFHEEFAQLISIWGVSQLLDVYMRHLSHLRDTVAARKQRFRPVAQARKLDNYIMRDGIDLSMIAEEVKTHSDALSVHRYTSTRFIRADDSRGPNHPPSPGAASQDLSSSILSAISDRADQLVTSSRAATTGITASAELRQSISNARLQRSTLTITLVALAVAVASLYVAWVTLKQAESDKKKSDPVITVTIQTTPSASPTSATP